MMMSTIIPNAKRRIIERFISSVKRATLAAEFSFAPQSTSVSVKIDPTNAIAEFFSKSDGQLALKYLENTIMRCFYLYANEYVDILGEVGELDVQEIREQASKILQESDFTHAALKDMRRLSCMKSIRSAFFYFIDDIENSVEDIAEYSKRFEHMRNTFGEKLQIAAEEEWLSDRSYEKLILNLNESPNSQAAQTVNRWVKYRDFLINQFAVDKIEGETFTLNDLYVPLAAWRSENNRDKKAFELDERLQEWVNYRKDYYGKSSDKELNKHIILVTGGPGYGKSTVLKHFAYQLALGGNKVVYVSLKYFFVNNDILESLSVYMRHPTIGIDGFTKEDFYVKNDEDEKIILIFDGIDEISQQGAIGRQAIANLMEQIDKYGLSETNSAYWLVLGGRDEAFFCMDLQMQQSAWNLLPYKVSERYQYHYEGWLLEKDRRAEWWDKYKAAKGQNTQLTLEIICRYPQLEELSRIPVLNYLIATTISDEENLKKIGSRNQLYERLIKSVYHREWDGAKHKAVSQMTEEDFFALFVQVGMSAWKNGGVFLSSNSENPYNSKRLKQILDSLEKVIDPAQNGLVLCFYMRRRDGLKNAVEFVHKSFWEYLAVEQIYNFLDECVLRWDNEIDEQAYIELFRYQELSENMWDMLEEKMTSLHDGQPTNLGYMDIGVCTRETAITNSEKILVMLSELLSKHDQSNWNFTQRKSYHLEHNEAGILEWTLMRLISIVAFSIKKRWEMPPGECLHNILGGQRARGWGVRVQGPQQSENTNTRPASIMGACLTKTNMHHISLVDADMRLTDMHNVELQMSDFTRADLSYSYLSDAKFRKVRLKGANLSFAYMYETDLSGADLENASFVGIKSNHLILRNANLIGADFRDAILDEADFTGARISGIAAKGARFGITPTMDSSQWKEWEVALTRDIPVKLMK